MAGHYRKIVLVVADGLRPDAITGRSMPVLSSLMAAGWRAACATTVRPSTTVAALGSLATGVDPAAHGLAVPALQRLPRPGRIQPLPLELRRLGVPTRVFAPELGPRGRWLAGALLRLAGVSPVRFGPGGAAQLGGRLARSLAGNREREFAVLYLNDADLAGHAWGWMSPGYFAALAALDQAMERLAPLADDPECLVIVTADHGGGGVRALRLRWHGPCCLPGTRSTRSLCHGDGMGLSKQPPRRKGPAEAPGRAARLPAGGDLPRPLNPEAGEDELFRDPFADFLPSTR
ncbi:MAG TPA: alkaline phosphatase family protein [Gemmatimonadales bacterium]|nr:alkaline phosphatase family protein [Gemmatimonadales bacterium]